MAELEPPRITFPCDYPIKVMGVAGDDFEARAFSIVQRYDSSLSWDNVKVNPSNKGNYLSITLNITATGQQQLEDLFEELKTLDGFKLVL